MGIFDFFNKSEKVEDVSEESKILDGAESNDIIIPNHIKVTEEKKIVAQKKPSQKVVFRVNGIYAVGGDVMLSGIVENGTLRKRMKVKIKDKESVVSDIKKGSESIKELLAKEEGTIFLKGKNLFLVRTQDLLEFK